MKDAQQKNYWFKLYWSLDYKFSVIIMTHFYPQFFYLIIFYDDNIIIIKKKSSKSEIRKKERINYYKL
jgi:hypothetical protein